MTRCIWTTVFTLPHSERNKYFYRFPFQDLYKRYLLLCILAYRAKWRLYKKLSRIQMEQLMYLQKNVTYLNYSINLVTCLTYSFLLGFGPFCNRILPYPPAYLSTPPHLPQLAAASEVGELPQSYL